LLAGATLGATTLLAANAQAATYVVNTATDSNDGSCGVSPNPCSLRDAINAANGDTSGDTITFDPSVTGTINLGSALPPITTTQGLEIQGPGASSLTISGGGHYGIFAITHGSDPFFGPPNSITGLTLTQGSNSDPGGAVSDQSLDPLVLGNDVITHNESTVPIPGLGGGGVFAEGPLTITASTISGNAAGHGGGVLTDPSYYSGGPSSSMPKYATPLVIENSRISGNHAYSTNTAVPAGGGGGIMAYGAALVVRDSTVSGNTSKESGGGISDFSKYGLKVSHSKVTGNRSVFGGGGILDEGWIVGRKYDPTEISASTISGNRAEFGAGVGVLQYTHGPGSPEAAPTGQPVTIESSTISRNHAVAPPGPGGPAHTLGGGIGFFGDTTSPFRLVDSTVTGNSADKGGGVDLGIGYEPLAGTDSFTGQRGSISLENSTIARNTAKQFHGGGGIYLAAYKTSSSSPVKSGTAGLESTIVSGNRAHGAPNDLERSSSATTGGFKGAFSLIQHPGSAPLSGQHLILGKNPQLGPLANNGGPTETMKPSGKSPVIDQGHAGLGFQTDQRGDARTVDAAIPNPSGGDGTDIGAFELSQGQVVPAPQPGFSARVGKQLLGGSSTPLLIDGVTKVTCHVNVGLLQACALEVTAKGRDLAGGGIPASTANKRLTMTVNSSRAAQRYLLKHYPLGIVASAKAVGLASGPASAMGPVRLLGGPTITLPLGTGSTKFSKKVDSQLDQAAKLLAGANKVTLTSDSSTQAAAVRKRLTDDGFKGQIKIKVSKHSPDHQITIAFQY
jgi:CSLREA domain-containing protein